MSLYLAQQINPALGHLICSKSNSSLCNCTASVSSTLNSDNGSCNQPSHIRQFIITVSSLSDTWAQGWIFFLYFFRLSHLTQTHLTLFLLWGALHVLLMQNPVLPVQDQLAVGCSPWHHLEKFPVPSADSAGSAHKPLSPWVNSKRPGKRYETLKVTRKCLLCENSLPSLSVHTQTHIYIKVYIYIHSQMHILNYENLAREIKYMFLCISMQPCPTLY